MSETRTTLAAAAPDSTAALAGGGDPHGADPASSGQPDDLEPLSSSPIEALNPQRPEAGGDGRWDVTLLMQVPDVDPPLEGWLEAALAGIANQAAGAASGGELAITVVDDATMADLHLKYKSVPGTTDVLTFDLRDGGEGPLEGDIVICLDEAVRQAAERGHPARLEALLYAVHGLLHLLGEDDQSAEDAARMHRLEDELLTAAGFGAVFAASQTIHNG